GRRGIGVERGAALLEQLRLGIERGILVQLEESRLDLEHLLGWRPTRLLILNHLARSVVIVQVVARDRTEDPDQLHRCVLELLAIGSRDQLRQSVDALYQNLPLPREVVEAYVVEDHPVRRDTEDLREL